MSHTYKFGNTTFTCNEDLSGSVAIQTKDAAIQVPGAHLIHFVAEYVRRVRIQRLEDAHALDILDLPLRISIAHLSGEKE